MVMVMMIIIIILYYFSYIGIIYLTIFCQLPSLADGMTTRNSLNENEH